MLTRRGRNSNVLKKSKRPFIRISMESTSRFIHERHPVPLCRFVARGRPAHEAGKDIHNAKLAALRKRITGHCDLIQFDIGQLLRKNLSNLAYRFTPCSTGPDSEAYRF